MAGPRGPLRWRKRSFTEASTADPASDGVIGRADTAWYDGWDDPLVAAREALRWGAGESTKSREHWSTWLRQRGENVTWTKRLDVPSVGAVTVVEAPYCSVIPAPVTVGPIDDPWQAPGVPTPTSSAGGRFLEVERATVVGGWDVIETSRGACWPALGQGLDQALISNALDRKLIGWTRDHMLIHPTEVPEQTLPTAIFLLGEHSTQFGHWMSDHLFRLLALRGRVSPGTPVLVDEGFFASAAWWLHVLLPDCPTYSVSPGQSVAVEHLIVPLQRAICPIGFRDALEFTPEIWPVDPRAALLLREAATGIRRGPSGGASGRRLLLERGAERRGIVNWDQVLAVTEGLDFDVLRVETIPVDALLEILTSASLVVAPDGSHLMNFYGAAGSRRFIILEGPVMQARAGMAGCLAYLGNEVVFVGGVAVGEEPRTPYEAKQRPFSVDVDALATVLADFTE